MNDKVPVTDRKRLLLAAVVLVISIVVWTAGLLNLAPLDPQVRREKRDLSRFIQDNAPDLAQQRMLARAYWKRYEDIRTDDHFGEDGPAGIFGARNHYRQHGKREGRIYGPTPEVADLAAEKLLAEAYWNRYPDIAASVVWGKSSNLGVLGPRDHYRYVGTYEGRIWGVTESSNGK